MEDMGHRKEEPVNSQGSIDWGCEPAGLAPINPREANKLHNPYAAGACGRGCEQTKSEVDNMGMMLCCIPSTNTGGMLGKPWLRS